MSPTLRSSSAEADGLGPFELAIREAPNYPARPADVEGRRPTEIGHLTGSLVREAGTQGVPVPLHTALYRLVTAKEALWREPDSHRQAHQEA